MSAIPDHIVDEMRKATLASAIDAIDKAEILRDIPAGKRFRRGFLRAIHTVIESAYKDTMVAALNSPNLSVAEKSQLTHFAAVANLYVAAIMDLIVNGSAQWDDPLLLPEQFKHQMRELMTKVGTVDIETGEIRSHR